MGGTGASTGEWLSLIKFITLWHLGCRCRCLRLALKASPVAGRGIVERDPAVEVANRERLSVGAERSGPNKILPFDIVAHFAGLSVEN